MKQNDQISYYCFNKACAGSVYATDNVEITELPFSEHTLLSEHFCVVCNGKLISVVDIELRQAMFKSCNKAKLPRFAQRV